MSKLLAGLGAWFPFLRGGKVKRLGYSPYTNRASNAAYNLLFSDKLELFQRDYRRKRTSALGVWPTLLAPEPYAAGLQAIAEDRSQESRARLLAYYRLREIGHSIGAKELLGTVIEVMLPDGLDALAAYSDRSVRYIHHSQSVEIFEPSPVEWLPTLLRLSAASQSAIDQIGPWLQARAAPPTEGMIRMTFLVSDGLYFGQGLLNVMSHDELAAPIVAASTDLLKSVTKASGS